MRKLTFKQTHTHIPHSHIYKSINDTLSKEKAYAHTNAHIYIWFERFAIQFFIFSLARSLSLSLSLSRKDTLKLKQAKQANNTTQYSRFLWCLLFILHLFIYKFIFRLYFFFFVCFFILLFFFFRLHYYFFFFFYFFSNLLINDWNNNKLKYMFEWRL